MTIHLQLYLNAQNVSEYVKYVTYYTLLTHV